MSNVEIFKFSTRELNDKDKFEAWQNQNTMADLKLSAAGIGASTDLDGVFHGAHIGNLMLGTFRYTTTTANDSLTYDAIRTPQRIKHDGYDHYFFRISREHAWQSKTDAGAIDIGPQQLFFADLARPLHIDIQSGDVVILMVPRDFIPIDLSAKHGEVFSGLMASLASQYILGLAERIDTIRTSESKAVDEVTLNMLLAAAFPTSDNIEPVRSNLEVELLKKIKAYINSRLESPALCVDSICHDIGLSRAALYRLFSTENHGVAEYIKLIRLRKIYYILRYSSGSRIRISELANRYGFCYNSAFAKLFKQSFGCSPSDIRRNATTEHRSDDLKEMRQGMALDFKEWHQFRRCRNAGHGTINGMWKPGPDSGGRMPSAASTGTPRAEPDCEVFAME
ncbi:helix-turn-helix domain-containing protein [Burkholderia alba]|uniref:helix-turn-helix domain-containing protein n=1 Tax=Burkholderia alba TaxID=2683677 RepID=UPI002B061BBF|nr:helix-turn-helix domain-containing protein [Burkholderia alba]